jgi:predicted nucleotide-binding protein
VRIGITGSWRERNREFWSLRSTLDVFAQACTELGSAVARSGAQITVGSDAKWAADWHFVQGYLAVVDEPHAPEDLRIRVVRPKGGEPPFESQFQDYAHVFEYLPSEDVSWRHVRLQFVSSIDTLITVGGGDGTYQAGLEAKLAKKRLVPLGSFGGASARLLADLLKSGGTRRSSALSKLNNPWSKHSVEHAMAAVGANEPSRVLLVHGHSDDRKPLQRWLRKEKLANSIVMADWFSPGLTLPEKFEKLAAEADAAVALATPDDLGFAVRDAKSNARTRGQQRARQNVWIEVGWFWGRLGRDRVLVLVRGNVEIPSDLQGIEVHRYSKSPTERTTEVRAFLRHVSQKN